MEKSSLKFWPWMLSENLIKAGAPIILTTVSIINMSIGNFDTGFMFLYGLSVVSVFVSVVGITKHWKLLKDLESKGEL